MINHPSIIYIYAHFTVTITLGPYKHYIETGRFSQNITYTDTSMTQITTASPIFYFTHFYDL